MKKNSLQFNTRMSLPVRKVLRDSAVKSGLSQAQVLEMCILRHAITIPELADEAKKALADIVSKPFRRDKPKD